MGENEARDCTAFVLRCVALCCVVLCCAAAAIYPCLRFWLLSSLFVV